MSAPKFTPGPWELDPQCDDGDGGQAIDKVLQDGSRLCIAQAWGTFSSLEIDETGMANAHLIAAAPELYSELAKLVAKIGNDEPVSSFDLQDASAALAKAVQP